MCRMAPGFPPLGLSQWLNDTVPVADSAMLLVDTPSGLNHTAPVLQKRLNNPVRLLFGEPSPQVPSFQPLSTDLPANVHLLTLRYVWNAQRMGGGGGNCMYVCV